jgi:hypothetical protein
LKMERLCSIVSEMHSLKLSIVLMLLFCVVLQHRDIFHRVYHTSTNTSAIFFNSLN